LDGTLLRSDGTVSHRTAHALRAAEDAGIVVVIATGRPPRFMHPVAEAIGHTGLAICANGAVTVDLHTEQVVDVRPLAADAIIKVVEAVRSELPDVTFAIETAERGFAQEPEYPTHPNDTEQRQIRRAPIEELVDDDIIKLLIRHHAMGPDELLAAGRSVAGDVAELTHSSTVGMLEVSAPGVTKASTLAGIAEQRGFGADQVVVFGDMPNDLPMLAWAGTGYAMANAHSDVLAATRFIAPRNDEDGVAEVVERLLLGNGSASEADEVTGRG
jgi:Cof subfamily protein (haloacid dehalogenase superfamily)